MVSGLRLDEWERGRRVYAYPAVCLVRKNGKGPSCVPLGSSALFADVSRANQATDDVLEEFHRKLLLSDNPEDRLHGAASVTFWGFFASADRNRKPNTGRALKRAEWVVLQRSQGRGEWIDASKLLGEARDQILRRELGAAWDTYRKIPNIGPSFASKLVAFSCPESAGVLDSVVQRAMQKNLAFPRLIASAVQKYSASSFQTWCKWCTDTAVELNMNGSRWSNATGTMCQWRAIDVERAIFGIR